jgi:hypothetical protein
LKESPAPETMVEAPSHSKIKKRRRKKKPTKTVTQKLTTPHEVSSGEDDVQSKTQSRTYPERMPDDSLMCDFSFWTNLSLSNNIAFNYSDIESNQHPKPISRPDDTLTHANCKYLDIIDFATNVKQKLVNNNSLNVLCYNIRSIRDKWFKFKDLISFNGVCPFDVIGLTETWLSDNDDTSDFSLPGYQIIHMPRRLTKCSGGISLYIRSNVNFTRKSECKSIFSR